MTRKHTHEEVFPLVPQRLFKLLHTPSAIRAWWGASHAIVLERPGGCWVAAWGSEDNPDYVTAATMKVFEPPVRIVFGDYQYYSRSGPLPFEAEFTTEFTVSAHPEGATLRVEQDGFPEAPAADAFYEACAIGWRNTFDGIRSYVSSLSSASNAVKGVTK
jgi:uncharacterized protein YndB with AHSA1/START domain